MANISVLMTVHNEERFLAEALESLRRQTFKNFEVIVVNDGSTDGTESILGSYAWQDPRIKVFHETRGGRSRSLNLAFRYSKGELIAIMDSDDISRPDRLEKQMAFLETHPELGMAVAYYEQIDARGQVIKQINQLPLVPEAIRAALAVDNPICHGTVMVRRNVMAEAGVYREAFLAAVDYDLYLRVLGHAEIGMIPEILYQYRVHGTAMSSRRLLQLQMKSLAAHLHQERLQYGQDSLQKQEKSLETQRAIVKSFLDKDLERNRKEYGRILWELGRKYYRLGETEAAIQTLKSAFQLDSSRVGTLRYLGKAYLKQLTRSI